MDSGKVENLATTSTKFEHFDVLENVASDHHYIGKKSHNYAIKALMKEWEILRDNIPETIYIQVYEPRIDLLRAVIIGPHLTPYHDGLFFFDLYLPSDYPNKPPEVYYHSHGYRLNPNLYNTGKVCLSLINTWLGRSSERWRKKESTILQLLVSIQGLVLNSRPYFNEPGYADYKKSNKTIWVNASKSYNENVFLLSCMTMVKTIQKPPVGFSVFVVDHFKQRSASILAAISAYQNCGVMVGLFQMDGSSCSSSSTAKVSSEFKSKLEKLSCVIGKAFAKLPETLDPKKDKVSNGKEKGITDELDSSLLMKIDTTITEIEQGIEDSNKQLQDIVINEKEKIETEKDGVQPSHDKETNGAMNHQENVNRQESSPWDKFFGCFKQVTK